MRHTQLLDPTTVLNEARQNGGFIGFERRGMLDVGYMILNPDSGVVLDTFSAQLNYALGRPDRRLKYVVDEKQAAE
jgi:hypothetical protein